jgi:hypothetical protein
MIRIRITVVVALLLLVNAAPARADVYIAALFGAATGGALDGSKTTYGGQLGILGSGLIGVEGDYGFTTKTKHGLGGDNFRTLTGSILIAPMSIGSEKLRPYAAVGGGIIGAASEMKHLFLGDDTVQTAPVITAGGGLFAYLTNQIGVRLDGRYVKAMVDSNESASESRSHFIRVMGGVVVRF